MKIKKRTIYLLVLMIYFTAKYFEYTTVIRINGVQALIDVIKDICYVVFIAMWGIEIGGKKRYPAISLTVVMLMILYFGYQGFVKNRADIFGVILCGLNFKQRYFEEYMKKIYVLSVSLFLMTIVMSVLGIIENEVAVGDKWGLHMIRSGYGFTYSGQFAMMLIPIVFMYYYLHHGKVSMLQNFFWIIVDIVVFAASKTFTGSTLVFVFIVVCNLERKRIKRPLTLREERWIIASPYLCVGICMALLVSWHFGLRAVKYVDIILNHRLELGVKYALMYGVRLFGTDYVNGSESRYQILDSEYMYTLVSCGILYLVVMTILMGILIKYMIRDARDKTLCIIWILLFVNSIVNNGIFNIVMDPFIIVIFPAVESCFKKIGVAQYGKKKDQVFDIVSKM